MFEVGTSVYTKLGYDKVQRCRLCLEPKNRVVYFQCVSIKCLDPSDGVDPCDAHVSAM